MALPPKKSRRSRGRAVPPALLKPAAAAAFPMVGVGQVQTGGALGYLGYSGWFADAGASRSLDAAGPSVLPARPPQLHPMLADKDDGHRSVVQKAQSVLLGLKATDPAATISDYPVAAIGVQLGSAVIGHFALRHRRPAQLVNTSRSESRSAEFTTSQRCQAAGSISDLISSLDMTPWSETCTGDVAR